MSANGEIPAGNEELKDLLHRCLLWSQIVLERLAPFEVSYFSIADIRQKGRNARSFPRQISSFGRNPEQA